MKKMINRSYADRRTKKVGYSIQQYEADRKDIKLILKKNEVFAYSIPFLFMCLLGCFFAYHHHEEVGYFPIFSSCFVIFFTAYFLRNIDSTSRTLFYIGLSFIYSAVALFSGYAWIHGVL